MLNEPVLLHADSDRIRLPKALLLATARLIYRKERIPLARETHVVFCSDRAIQKLNAGFRGIKGATDVLSFNYDDHDLLGEIYISLQRARIQARRFHVSRDNEILRLFIHGMFHLLGFDHETERERRIMEAKESKFLPKA